MPVNSDPRVVNPSVASAARPVDRAAVPGAGGSRDPTLRDIGRALVEGRWILGGVVAAAIALGSAYVLVAPRVYRATALIHVEDRSARTDALEKLTAMFEQKTTIGGEIELLRSRLAIGPVVEQLHLDVVAAPRRAPFVGSAIARRYGGQGLAPPLFGISRYGWGGERIAIDRLEVPDDLVGLPLRLTALDAGRYRLSDPAGKTLVEGRLGAAASAPPGAPQVDVLVSELVANAGTQFAIEKRSRDDVVDALQDALQIGEKGKDTGVIEVALEGGDPARVAAIVSALSSGYVRQHVERRTAELEKTLEVLQSKIPAVKANLESAEAALNAFRAKNRITDLTLDATAGITRAGELDRQLTLLDMEHAEMTHRYGARYPELAPLRAKIEAVQAERALVEQRLRALPVVQLATARLMRDVSVATGLYTYLLEKAQTLAVARSGMLGSARIVDLPAVPRRPVTPKPMLALGFALLAGVGAGAVLAIARRSPDERAEDAHDVEAATGLPVLVTVPHSDREAQLQRRTSRRPQAPLAAAAPDDGATEQLRTLRTALGFMMKGHGNVVAVSSPSPGVGKTFVCANLAQLLAAAGKRVLLVDGDLRRGVLHWQLSVEAQPGLSEAVGGAATLDQAIRATASKGLDLLPRGEVPPSPAELLARPALQELLAEAARRYDVVLVDTPPSLAVTDPILVGRCADLNLLVLRAGEHPIREISLALEGFARSGVQVHGAIVNDLRPIGGRYARVYGTRRAAAPDARPARA